MCLIAICFLFEKATSKNVFGKFFNFLLIEKGKK